MYNMWLSQLYKKLHTYKIVIIWISKMLLKYVILQNYMEIQTCLNTSICKYHTAYVKKII